MGGGRNLATYPRCPKCHRKRDVAYLPWARPPWYCQPCDLNFFVRAGFSLVKDGDLEPYPADIKKVYYCRRHYREHLGVCPACKSQGLEVAHGQT